MYRLYVTMRWSRQIAINNFRSNPNTLWKTRHDLKVRKRKLSDWCKNEQKNKTKPISWIKFYICLLRFDTEDIEDTIYVSQTKWNEYLCLCLSVWYVDQINKLHFWNHLNANEWFEILEPVFQNINFWCLCNPVG